MDRFDWSQITPEDAGTLENMANDALDAGEFGLEEAPPELMAAGGDVVEGDVVEGAELDESNESIDEQAEEAIDGEEMHANEIDPTILGEIASACADKAEEAANKAEEAAEFAEDSEVEGVDPKEAKTAAGDAREAADEARELADEAEKAVTDEDFGKALELYMSAAEKAADAEEACEVACAAAKMGQGAPPPVDAGANKGGDKKAPPGPPAVSAAPKAKGMAGWADRTLSV
jgi:hypothetical protein